MTLEEIAAAYIARRGLSPLNIMERNLARIIENALREDDWRVVKLSEPNGLGQVAVTEELS